MYKFKQMNIKKHIPNTITAGNLFCGCLAVIKVSEGNYVDAVYLVGLALILDFLDGFAARLLNVKSEIGAQLDSLADMITFGFVPGLLMYSMLNSSIQGAYPYWVSYIGFLITIFSAVRLAKFNIDVRQTEAFFGLPTPANAIMICSLPLIIHFQPFVGNVNLIEWISNPIFLLVLTVLSSYLMIADVELIALKFQNFSWADNKMRYFLIGLIVILLLAFKILAVPLILFSYLILSVFGNSKEAKKKTI